jgi:ABC-type polysaccharide/polyol phosphate export permease
MSLRTAAAHRNLLYLLTLKELRTRYKQSILGWAWSLLNPITQMLIFTFVFLYVFDAAAPVGDPSGLANFPLYFLSGALPFNFLSISVSVAIASVQGGAGLIRKVSFPHEHLVFSVIAAQFVTLLIEFAVLTVALMIAGNMVLPWLPVLLLVLGLLALFTSGVALALSAANVFFHDVSYLWSIAVQLLFYSTPIIYQPSFITVDWLRAIVEHGPTGTFITAVHDIVYDLQMPGTWVLVRLVVMSAAVFALGAWVFGRLSPRFAEEM